MSFKNKVVLITGAAVGIGRETALAFAREQAFLIINYSKSEKEANETLEQVKKLGGDGIISKADVSKEDDVRKMFEECGPLFGGIDILVNNAGVTAFIPFKDLESANDAVWTRLFDINVKGAFFCSREAAKWMGSRKAPCIVNISSQSGMRPLGSSIPYSVSKAALIHLSECLAVTLAPHIRVNCVAPGYVDLTRWNEGREGFSPEKTCADMSRMIPLGRVAVPSDIAAAILFLAEENNYCNGVTLPVEGGRVLV
jgi:3-oxoacyl-[acyl-carrier protein] reductase